MAWKILIADDTDINRKIIKNSLFMKMKNIVFYEAEDGSQAIQILKEKAIDLVVLDLMMPSVDGFMVLSEIRKYRTLSEIPVIVNSALDGLDHIKRAFQLGAYDYFTKPLTREQIEFILPLKVYNAVSSYERKKELLKKDEAMAKDLRIAGVLQHTLMRKEMEYPSGRMFGRYISSEGVSGDLYDCIQKGDALWFIVADVTGHGVAAAMISSMIKVAFENSLDRCSKPHEVLKSLNEFFYNLLKEHYGIVFTAFVGKIQEGVLEYASGGQPYPFLFDLERNQIEMLEEDGLPIGIFWAATYETRQKEISKNSVIFAYTDGIFDMLSTEENQNWESLYEYCNRKKDQFLKILNNEPKEFISYLLYDIVEGERIQLKDDVAVMMIQNYTEKPR